ncbi:hypothetical protein Tco_0327403 [Tanacetum coccineum]
MTRKHQRRIGWADRDVHSAAWTKGRSPSESPPSSDSEDSRRKRRRRIQRPIQSTQSISRNNSYQRSRGGSGERQVHPTVYDPKGGYTATEGANFQGHHQMLTPEEQRRGETVTVSIIGRRPYYQLDASPNLRQLNDKLVKEGRLITWLKNLKEGKDKQRARARKERT